jgi:NAD(P)-dependent dehydrogenase (short-subunit alcohol dehydrogenase family)
MKNTGMNRAAVTGHTSGIGYYIKSYFESKGYEVSGYSRSTGFDISSLDDREFITRLSSSYDVFVNNAYNDYDDSQLEMLKSICNEWKRSSAKTIINISSRSILASDPYSKTKFDLDQYCDSYKYSKLRLVNLKPGLIDTPRVRTLKGNKMCLEQIGLVLDFCMNESNDFKVHSLCFGL